MSQQGDHVSSCIAPSRSPSGRGRFLVGSRTDILISQAGPPDKSPERTRLTCGKSGVSGQLEHATIGGALPEPPGSSIRSR